MPYDPVFTSMWKQKLVAPVFSLAISRAAVPASNAPDGFLALGGLPPVATYGQTARVPIEYVAEGPSYVYGSLPPPQYRTCALLPPLLLRSLSRLFQPAPLPSHANLRRLDPLVL